jgi:thioredoxin 1
MQIFLIIIGAVLVLAGMISPIILFLGIICLSGGIFGLYKSNSISTSILHSKKDTCEQKKSYYPECFTGTDISEVTDASFEYEIHNGIYPVMIYIQAQWCGVCHSFDPVIAELSNIFKGRLKVIACDSDMNSRVTSKCRVNNIPSMVFFKDGIMCHKIEGAFHLGFMHGAIERILGRKVCKSCHSFVNEESKICTFCGHLF